MGLASSDWSMLDVAAYQTSFRINHNFFNDPQSNIDSVYASDNLYEYLTRHTWRWYGPYKGQMTFKRKLYNSIVTSLDFQISSDLLRQELP